MDEKDLPMQKFFDIRYSEEALTFILTYYDFDTYELNIEGLARVDNCILELNKSKMEATLKFRKIEDYLRFLVRCLEYCVTIKMLVDKHANDEYLKKKKKGKKKIAMEF